MTGEMYTPHMKKPKASAETPSTQTYSLKEVATQVGVELRVLRSWMGSPYRILRGVGRGSGARYSQHFFDRAMLAQRLRTENVTLGEIAKRLSGIPDQELEQLLAGGGEASHFSVTMLAGADPVDAGVSADSLVLGVNEDNFEELEAGILTNPVRVEHAEVGALAADTHLSDSLVGLFLLELADAVVNGLTENDTLADVSLTATTSNAGAVDNEALAALVTEAVSLVSAGGSAASVDGGKLTELPRTHSEHES